MPYAAFPNHKVAYDADGLVMLIGTPTAGAVTTLNATQIAELNDADQVVAASQSESGQMRVWFFFAQPWQLTHWYAHVYPDGLGTLSITLNSVEGSNNTVNGTDGTWETATLTGGTPSGIATGATRTFDLWRTDLRAITFTQPFRAIRVTISNTATSAGPAQNYVSFHWYGTRAAATHDLLFINDATGLEFALPYDAGDVQRDPDTADQLAPKAMRIRNASATRTATTTTVSLPTQSPAINGVSLSGSSSGPWTNSVIVGTIAPGADSSVFYVNNIPTVTAPLGPEVFPLQVTADLGFF